MSEWNRGLGFGDWHCAAMTRGSSIRALARRSRSLWSALDSKTSSASLQRGDVLGSPHTSEHLGAFPIHQVRSLVGGTRPERKEDTEDAPNMPRLSSSGTMGRRFYKKAHMRPVEDGSGYVVLLDSRELKTPARKPLKVPNPALALAIAAEWEWQVSHLRMLEGLVVTEPHFFFERFFERNENAMVKI